MSNIEFAGGNRRVRVSGEMPERMMRYDYQSERERAGVPEGGVLTIRDAGHSVEL